MNSRILISLSLITLLLLILYRVGYTRVTGNCVNCHTMHNSQNGTNMQFANESDKSAKESLLRASCIGCHGQNPSGLSNIISGIPQVWHNATTDLAGGNFGYVSTKTGASDDKGHNPRGDLGAGYQEDTLTSPPGDENATGITNINFVCAGQFGCHGNRAISGKLPSLRGAHHTDDRVLKFGTLSLASQGGSVGLSYRFLFQTRGGEDTDWQNTLSASDHNEYLGATATGSESTVNTNPSNTISGLCAECHGNFHGPGAGDVGTASPWLRHPTDVTLPATGEYTAYTVYNTVTPVARTSGWTGWGGGGASSSTVTPSGTTDDIVMCLSCHRAHASPYFKSLRWNYKGTLSEAISGCAVCHRSKN